MENTVLELLEKAKALLLEENAKGRGSRENSSAITKIDEARHWHQDDLQLKKSSN